MKEINENEKKFTLKEQFFSDAIVTKFAKDIEEVTQTTSAENFLKLYKETNWKNAELMQRIALLSETLHKILPTDYEEAIEILKILVVKNGSGFHSLVFPRYVSSYGLEHFKISLPALAFFTQFSSSEFAIRYFIQKEPEKVMEIMLQWADNENFHIRRLASEGCRPRLPWGIALKNFIQNPQPILPILEKLKNDNEDYVRRSVANNLNDISKDHKELVLDIAKKWINQTPQTDWILKHACRTLLKKGNPTALNLFGIDHQLNVRILNFSSNKKDVNIGSFIQLNAEYEIFEDAQNVRIEYIVHYVKANGSTSPKVFQWKQTTENKGIYKITKKHNFLKLTTRKLYTGVHSISLVFNGKEVAKTEIFLSENII